MFVRRAWLVLSLLFSHGVTAAAVPEVIIDPGGVGPVSLRSIHRAVDAITRLAEDQDLSEVSRLRRRAHDATVSALQTQGYYDAVVTLEVGQLGEQESWDIIIKAGERTVVDKVDLTFRGQITDPEFKVRLEGLRTDWPLQQGEIFLNDSWADAKQELLTNVKSKDFYFARYERTRAIVQADEAKADLELDVQSGPRVRMGELNTSGLKRVPRSLIDRYVRYSPGDPYDQDKLDQWQQALQSTTFFRGAFVTLDSEPSQQKVRADGEVEIPVNVRVTEAPARRFTGSLGADSDHGVRVEGLYRQNIVFGQPVWTETGIGVDKDRQRFFRICICPPPSKAIKVAWASCSSMKIFRGWTRLARHWAGSYAKSVKIETGLITKLNGA
nr:POTRA domain-containing protein [Paenalcaligenes niemegkensis]